MLYLKIVRLYPSLAPEDFTAPQGKILLRDDGAGPYIASWNHPTLPQPTQEQLDAIVIDPDAPVVPESITPRQCRLILSQQGLLSSVEAMIAQSTDDVRITWEYALEFKRNDPLLIQLGTNLGLTPDQIDQFFIAAAQL